MDTLYKQLIPQIVNKLSIKSEDNIEVLEKMHLGFSGAEIYAIELKHPSYYTGKFFLKIDSQEEEFYNHKVSQYFKNSVEYIQTVEIDSYYIMLIQIAGNSSLEYKSFFDSAHKTREKLLPQIIKEILDSSLNKKIFSPQPMSLSQICSKMLSNKISRGGRIEKFLLKK